jgi:hypothetical protein
MDRSLIEQEVATMRGTEAPGTDVLAAIDARIDDERIQNEITAETNGLAVLRRQNEAERINAVTHYASWQQQEGLEQAIIWCERWAGNLDAAIHDEKRMILQALKTEVRLYRAEHIPRAEPIISLPMSGVRALDLGSLSNCVEDHSSSSYQVSIRFQ